MLDAVLGPSDLNHFSGPSPCQSMHEIQNNESKGPYAVGHACSQPDEDDHWTSCSAAQCVRQLSVSDLI
jgi:hypothetical protein